MSDKEELIKEKLEFSGLFDFKAFYKFAYSWLDDESYGVIEKKYSEKVSGNARDVSIEWSISKEISDYFKIIMILEYEVSELVDVEVEIDKKKKKMNRGKILLEIKAALVKDPESKWETSPLLRLMRDFYNKYVIPGRLEAMRDKVIDDVKDFKEELKSFLELTGKRG
jgi:hypothetical protein